jgi:hypothetical protein
MSNYPFETPDERYRGLDLWMVNDDLDNEEIRRQVFEFKDKGFYSVVFRTYNGLISDYPGPLFKSKVRAAIEAAKECGMSGVVFRDDIQALRRELRALGIRCKGE